MVFLLEDPKASLSSNKKIETWKPKHFEPKHLLLWDHITLRTMWPFLSQVIDKIDALWEDNDIHAYFRETFTDSLKSVPKSSAA